jgi:hypothetical protein
MTLFEEIIADILTEDVNVGKINDAITRSYEVKINYESEDDKASGERIIQPVAYGLTKAGKPVIRAYQPFGDTQTSVPAWKFFLVSGIQTWKPLFKRVFNTPPPGFNPNGDKTMSTVYKVAKFFGQSNNVSKQPKPIKASGPVDKKDIEQSRDISIQNHPEIKKLAKLRKQLDNPRYISDIIKNKTFGTEPKHDNNTQMTANSGPVTKDSYATQTEKDIASRYEQLNKNERVPQTVLDQWQKEQEKKQKRKNYGSNRNGIE